MIPGTYPARKPEFTVAVGSRTPWGRADSARRKGPGIFEVSTPSHGGYKLDVTRNAKIPRALRRKGGWYEEDIDWAIVVLFLGHTFDFCTPDAFEDARSCVRGSFPDEYEAIFGVKVTPEQSHVLRQRAAKAAVKGKLQSVACWGDWSRNVPPGFVGVCARIDGRDGPAETEAYFVLSEAEYEASHIPELHSHLVPENAQRVASVDGECPFGPK